MEFLSRKWLDLDGIRGIASSILGVEIECTRSFINRGRIQFFNTIFEQMNTHITCARILGFILDEILESKFDHD